jgi:uncharacterized protein (DUF433 family)
MAMPLLDDAEQLLAKMSATEKGQFLQSVVRGLAALGHTINRTPGVVGGDACIRNTRIPVWTLVQLKKLGRTEEELLSDYPGLSQLDLDAAWAYYRANTVEIEEAIEQNDED